MRQILFGKNVLIMCSSLAIWFVSFVIPSPSLFLQCCNIFNNLKRYSLTVLEMEHMLVIIKLMNQDLVHLDRFDRTKLTWWQDKLKFILTALKIFYIIDSSLEPIVEASNKYFEEVHIGRKKSQEDKLICLCHILNVLYDCLYDL